MLSSSNWRNSRNTLFAHPKRIASALGLTSAFILLFPTCQELIPLGITERNAKRERDDAKDKCDQTSKKLQGIKTKISEDKQRILDLDCAMARYPGFNQGVIAFQKQINDTVTAPLNLLKSFWQIQFNPDQTTTDQFVTHRSWEKYEYDNFYSCFHSHCPKDDDGKEKSCCFAWDYHWVTRYYDEVTTIENKYKNIITGSPFQLPPLECGYYSRQFKTFPPFSYVTYESPHQESGTRESGKKYIDFIKEFASRVKVSFLLDGSIKDSTINVLRNVDLSKAAESLSENLYQFLAYGIAAFKMTGVNYPALQEGFRNEIPKLLAEAAIVNATLQQQALVLAEKQVIFDVADAEFQQGLRFWLPLLFLGSSGVGLLTYILISIGKNCFNTVNDIMDHMTPENPEDQHYVELDDAPSKKDKTQLDEVRLNELPPAYIVAVSAADELPPTYDQGLFGADDSYVPSRIKP